MPRKATIARLAELHPDPHHLRRAIGAMALAAGTAAEDARRAVIQARLPRHDWPTWDLRIVAVDAHTGDPVVFDRAAGVGLVDAVTASCAVPGTWPPWSAADRPDRAPHDPALHRDHRGRRPEGPRPSTTEEATVADLADEIVLRPQDDALPWPGDRPGRAAAFAPATTAEAIELVAAGVGLLVVPQSLARLHHRRDLTHRPLADAPGSGVGLTWPDTENSELMEEFIGIVRGRTVNSSRTPRRNGTPAPSTPAPTKKSVARRTPARGGTRRR